MYPNPKHATATATPIHRPIELASAVVARGGATFKPLPGWGENFASTAFLAQWHRETFASPADCLTVSPALARSSGRILIPADGKPYRIVLDFENDADIWDPKTFAAMEEYRAGLAKACPWLILSAFLGHARPLLSKQITLDDFLRHEEQLRNFASPFHEVSPCIYFDPGDDGMNPMQRRMLSAWRDNLAPGKPLSPVVWRFNKIARRNCTVAEWRIQLDAARNCLATRAVIMWDDLNGPAQQRDCELWAASVPAPAI